jgi:type I restriction enzyme S subunit
MEVKHGYKLTEAGVLPKDWDAVSLGALTPPNRKNGIVDGPFGSNLKSIHYRKSGIPIITSGYVTDGRFQAESYDYVDRSKFLEERRSAVSPGDIVMAKIGERCGASAILPHNHETGILSGNALKITVDESRHSTSYVWQVLWNMHVTGRLDVLRTVGAQPALSMANLKLYKIPVPPTKDEEIAIAEALSDVDRQLAELDRLIAKKRDLKQAAMQQLLTGKTRLPGFHGEWKAKTLFGLAEEKKELFDDGDWIEAEFLTESGIRLIQTGNIGEGQFNEREDKKYISPESFNMLRCKALRIGDILICRLAEPAGRACIVPDIGEERMITAVDVTIFRPPPSMADRRFLVSLFCTQNWFDDINERCGGSTRTRIARGELGKITVTLPPVPEQVAIADVLADMDAELTALEARRDKTVALKQAMMQELLTGKTRLV